MHKVYIKTITVALILSLIACCVMTVELLSMLATNAPLVLLPLPYCR